MEQPRYTSRLNPQLAIMTTFVDVEGMLSTMSIPPSRLPTFRRPEKISQFIINKYRLRDSSDYGEAKANLYTTIVDVHVVRREHWAPVQGLAVSGVGALAVRGNVARIAPAFLRLRRGKERSRRWLSSLDRRNPKEDSRETGELMKERGGGGETRNLKNAGCTSARRVNAGLMTNPALSVPSSAAKHRARQILAAELYSGAGMSPPPCDKGTWPRRQCLSRPLWTGSDVLVLVCRVQGYAGRDSLILPMILGAVTILLLLAVCACYAVKRRRQKTLRRKTIGVSRQPLYSSTVALRARLHGIIAINYRRANAPLLQAALAAAPECRCRKFTLGCQRGNLWRKLNSLIDFKLTFWYLWTLRKTEVLKLRAFEMWCWRRHLRIP
ncbi:hypothetical protein PR048_028662 [Dryococelus australis]|uniref:Uncharacterized protein n=1 Tax=Dryococelus australis TaxID=614101 RepID=A0ABQ9GEY2_9NEOP|nr:hypothetical protein PR048_028662 [Dryococelus australis]